MCLQALAIRVHNQVGQVLDIAGFMFSAYPNLIERVKMH